MSFVFNKKKYDERTEWFRNARFGMFIHWGLYAIPARGEWVRSYEELTNEDYQKYFDSFNPQELDVKKWVRAAKNAGMKYIILTAKHHDGFCLFDTKYSDYKVTNTKLGYDVVEEFLNAGREEGLKVGLYFSLIDWYHSDFPHYGDRQHPMRNRVEFSNENRNFDRYLELMHNQVKELCTNYGKLDLLWFDFSYDDMTGETWKSSELIKMVREYQPDIIINNRLEASGEGYGSLATGNPTPYHGDFVSPEQIVPPNGIRDVNGEELLWESCITMNNHWGYSIFDKEYKPAELLIKKLVECVSKGGNMLLNVGPDAKGNIPRESLNELEKIGEWLSLNGESIYNSGMSSIAKPEYGRITEDGKNLFVHVYENSIGPLPILGVNRDSVESMELLSTGAEILPSNSWVHSDYPDVLFADLGTNPILPNQIDTVIKIVMK